MAKMLPNCLFTAISGKLKSIEFRTRKNKVIDISERRKPEQPNTPLQQAQKTAYGRGVEAWKRLDYSTKQDYNKRAAPYGWSGYNLFMKEFLTPKWHKIVISNTDNPNNLTDYQVKIDLTQDPSILQDAFWDRTRIRFYDSDKSTLLSYFIAEWNKSANKATAFVKIPSIPTSSYKNIYLLVDPRFTTDESNGSTTFDFFDSFDDPTLPGWSISSRADVNVANSVLTLKSTFGTSGILSTATYTEPSKLIAMANLNNIDNYLSQLGFSMDIGNPDLGDVWSDRVLHYNTYAGTGLFTTNIETDDVNFAQIVADKPPGWILIEIQQDDDFARADIPQGYAQRAGTADVLDSYARNIAISVEQDDTVKLDYVAIAKLNRPEPYIYLIQKEEVV